MWNSGPDTRSRKSQILVSLSKMAIKTFSNQIITALVDIIILSIDLIKLNVTISIMICFCCVLGTISLEENYSSYSFSYFLSIRLTLNFNCQPSTVPSYLSYSPHLRPPHSYPSYFPIPFSILFLACSQNI